MTENKKASFSARGCVLFHIIYGSDTAEIKITNKDGESIKLTVFSSSLYERENDALSPTRVRELVHDSAVCRAYKKGLDLLAFCDNSKSKLVKKLSVRGFGKNIAEDAVALLEQKGYIKEGEHCMKSAVSHAEKGYGRRRISEYLYSLGFEKSYIESTMAQLGETVDFEENLKNYILKKNLFENLTSAEPKTRQKAYASILRRGYDNGEIRRALKEISES